MVWLWLGGLQHTGTKERFSGSVYSGGAQARRAVSLRERLTRFGDSTRDLSRKLVELAADSVEAVFAQFIVAAESAEHGGLFLEWLLFKGAGDKVGLAAGIVVADEKVSSVDGL